MINPNMICIVCAWIYVILAENYNFDISKYILGVEILIWKSLSRLLIADTKIRLWINYGLVCWNKLNAFFYAINEWLMTF